MSCKHLGKETGHVVKCLDGCRANVSLKLLECEKHGMCTVKKHGAGGTIPYKGDKAYHCCADCPDNTELARFDGTSCAHRREGMGSVQGVRIFKCAARNVCSVTDSIPGVPFCRICTRREPTGVELQMSANGPVSTKKILVTAGIGDLFALESFISYEERAAVETIYYACPAWDQCSLLMQSLSNYPRLKNHVVIDKKHVFHNIGEAEAVHGKIDADDFSIQKIFAENRRYSGSSFLLQTVASIEMRPKEPYALIVPYSSWGRWAGRGFDHHDWEVCINFLQRRNLRGVIVYRGREKSPAHPLILNLTNRTSMTEAVELLKGAAAYLGIDSALSVLAAKCSPELAVKSVSGHCYNWKHVYFAPRTDFSFLQRSLVI